MWGGGRTGNVAMSDDSLPGAWRRRGQQAATRRCTLYRRWPATLLPDRQHLCDDLRTLCQRITFT